MQAGPSTYQSGGFGYNSVGGGQGMYPPIGRGVGVGNQQGLVPYGSSSSYGPGPVQGQIQGQNPNQIGPYGQPSSSSFPTQFQPGVQGQQPPPSTTPNTKLTPQPIQVVSRDEDPLYGPLGRAKEKVARGMTADDEISYDLQELLAASQTHNQTSPADLYRPPPNPNDAYRPLRIAPNHASLPDALMHAMQQKKPDQASARMGLFEEIERAWFTVGNQLFLWDYNDTHEFSRYDEQPDTIHCVGLVKAKRDVFIDDITHILVICTATKATLIGLARPSPKQIDIFGTNLSVTLASPIISIHSTLPGRIIMLGADQDIYELTYNTPPGWLSFSSAPSGPALKKHTGPAPLVGFFGGSSNTTRLALDQSRNYLYALQGKANDVEMFDLNGDNGTGWQSVGRVAGAQGRPPVVLLHAVSQEESKTVYCITVSADGTRTYYGASAVSYIKIMRIAVRSFYVKDCVLAESSSYSSGTLFGIRHIPAAEGGGSIITTTTVNYGLPSEYRENFDNYTAIPPFLELLDQQKVPSTITDIVELPSTNPRNSPAYLRKKDAAGVHTFIALNPLARQVMAGARQFLILTHSGVYFATMPRAVDMLSADLEVDKERAIQTVGRVIQLGAMGVLLGCTSDLKQSDISSAISSILISSGSPFIVNAPSGRSITYSARHDGLALVLARILRGVWNSKVFSFSPAIGYGLGAPQKSLLDIQSRLEGLRRYLDQYPFPRQQADGDVKLAWDQEELSIHGLGLLVRQAVEAISFLLLLADHKISDIILKCDPNTRDALGALLFSSLFTGSHGRDLAKRLVTALIEQQIGQELGIDTLSEILQQRCGTFCQPGDVVMYKAEESIRRAESSRDPSERKDYLHESLRLFQKAGGSLPLQRLADVTKRYGTMGFIQGSITLPLHTALQMDPQDKANDYIRDGEHPSDPRKALYTSRMECYALVIEILSKFNDELDEATAAGNIGPVVQTRNEAYSLAIASDDELFHFYLYDWHVARHLAEQLLDFDTPYIEKYLEITSSSVEERRDLLWKYYARREEYLPAAKALFELATRASATDLHDRTYYLAQALTSAKSASSLGIDDVEFTSNLQERIDVAQVQIDVARAIDGHQELTVDEKSDALGQLRTNLVGLDELYQSFARPYRLYEAILLILKTADTRIDDVCEAVWRQLIQDAAKGSNHGGPLDARVGERIKELTRRFYPSEAAPIDIVVPAIYLETSGMSGAPGWTSEALLDGGIPLRDLWELAMASYETNPEDQVFYTEEVALLAQRWVHHKDQIPAAEVERFASAYLLRTNANDATERVRTTRDRMSAAKNAAGRY